MPFTICREATSRELFDQDEDARLVGAELLKQGISLARVPRVRPPEGRSGWLYAWQSREDAANVAAQLKRRTRDRWIVRETDQRPSLGPLVWLRMNLTEESEALLFALDPITEWMVEQRFPGSCRHASVVIGMQPGDDLLADVPHFLALARQALFMLTWVPLTELAVFGKFQIVAPLEPRVVLPPTPIVADEANEEPDPKMESGEWKAEHAIAPITPRPEVESENCKAVHGSATIPARQRATDDRPLASESRQPANDR